MTIQALEDIELPNGIRVRAGAILTVPDETGAALVKAGKARLREKPEIERKARMNPGDPLPPQAPFVRLPTEPFPARSFEPGLYEDQDNFVRNLVTYTPLGWWMPWLPWWPWPGGGATDPVDPVTPPPSASGRPAVVTLDQIKMHCRIDNTFEDSYLEELEMAAHIHTENYLRYQIDDTVGENVKIAELMLIAHWYRNREAVSMGRVVQGFTVPLGWEAILGLERDYPIY